MKALLEALVGKGKEDASSKDYGSSKPMTEGDDDDSDGPKAVMKEAAKDGDWDAFVDALCSYVGK